jgi:hypothetical protein
VVVGDIYGGWRVVQWLSTSVAGWVVNESLLCGCRLVMWLS